MKRDYAKEKEGKLSYNYCKDCSKRVMYAELELVEGVAYHSSCYAKMQRFVISARKKRLQTIDMEYRVLLRKHKGLGG